MKALWVTASPVGPSAHIMKVIAGTSGGWVQTVYQETKRKNISIDFLCFSKKIAIGDCKTAVSDDGETVYCLNMPKVSFGVKPPEALRKQVEEVIRKSEPDIVHIWGTETVVQNVVASCCPDVKKVVFLQGLIGLHSRYYGGRLKELGFKQKRKFKEKMIYLVKQKHMVKQADYEKAELRLAGNIILDSVFFLAYCHSAVPEAKCFKYWLNSNPVFERKQWSIDRCHHHRVFSVYGNGPDKGLHQLIRAAAIVKKDYPDLEIVIPGPFNIDKNGRLRNDVKLTSYEKLLFDLIKGTDLINNVFFCGKQTPEGMAEQLLNAHCFVNPSIMEAHAGSLREAMTVGVPSVTSICGSVVEFVQEGVTGWMYRYEEHEILAYKIMRIFEDDELADRVGTAARKKMQDMKAEYADVSMEDIYNEILGRCDKEFFDMEGK